MTLREIQVQAALRLAEEPELRETAGRDAELLVMHALALGRAALFAHPERLLEFDEVARMQALVSRRAAGEPVQYITGEQEFYGLPFRVTRATLIPRPETELLVEAVLERVSGAVRIVDVGTGSGAIAVALASRLPAAHLLAVDLSEAALEVARENAATNGVHVDFRLGDLLDGAGKGFDVVVSNPPYVPEADRAGLHKQVREFEPEGALFAGIDGLDIYRRLVPQAWEALKPGGLLAMEIGFDQQEGVRALLAGWSGIDFLRDLQRIPRTAVAWKIAAESPIVR